MKTCTCFLLLVIPYSLFAQLPPLQADRPDQTETPALVAKKYFQMETGFIIESGGGHKTFVHPSSLLKYGALENVELRLIVESQTVRPDAEGGTSVTGIVPIEAGLKIHLFDERKARPQCSLIGHVGIPWAATEEFRPEYFNLNFRFAFQNTLNERVSLSYNAGMEWDGESAEPVFIYTCAAGFSVTDKLSAFIELFGFLPQETRTEHLFDCGLTYLVKDNLMLDISGGAGLSKNAPDYFAGFGISFRLPD